MTNWEREAADSVGRASDCDEDDDEGRMVEQLAARDRLVEEPSLSRC